jgi:hypothetical protein
MATTFRKIQSLLVPFRVQWARGAVGGGADATHGIVREFEEFKQPTQRANRRNPENGAKFIQQFQHVCMFYCLPCSREKAGLLNAGPGTEWNVALATPLG